MRSLKTLFLSFIGLVFLPSFAWALTCDDSGGVASGDLYGTTGVCDSEWGLENIFSYIFCQFITVVNEALGQVYCSLQYEIMGPLSAAFTLYIAVFGAQILMGSVQMTVKEVMVRLLKITGIWIFVSETYWAIGIAFQFFVAVALQGTGWVWAGVDNAGQNPYNIDVAGSGSIMPIFHFFDQVIYDVVTGPFTEANSAVIGFFFVMWYLIPTIFMLAAYWLWLNFTLILRALIHYLIAMAALGFLLSLSPIFLSFMLFGITYQFFENWLKYMMSYSIQVIVVFAIIALWLASVYIFMDFFNELAEVIHAYGSLWVESAAKSDPVSSWGICPLQFTPPDIVGPHVTCENGGFDPVGNDEDKQDLIPAARFAQQGEFVFYMIYRLLTLIIIVYAFDALMRQAPYMAKSLAGPEYVPILGQGYGFSKYGIIDKAPEWAQKGGAAGKTALKTIDSNLGISKTAKDTLSNMSGKYTDSIKNILGKR